MDKLVEIFNLPHSIQIYNTLKRIDGEWENRICWRQTDIQWGNVIQTQKKWVGFATPEECIDDCYNFYFNKEK